MSVTTRVSSDRVIADCLSSDGVGSMVYITGPVTNGRYQVASCDPNDRDKMPAIGMLIEKLNSTTGIVQIKGVIQSVYSGLTPGEILFVDDGGGLSNVPPEPTIGEPYKFMQNAGTALSGGVINLHPNAMMARKNYQ